MRVLEKDKTYLVSEIDRYNKPIKIPSQMYPLAGTPYLFTAGNSVPFVPGEESEKIKSVFDSVDARVGACYSNTEELIEKLRIAGFHAQPMVGWLFLNGMLPVHHCFAVLGNHVLDLVIRPELLLGSHDGNSQTADRRIAIANKVKEAASRPNSEKCTFGQAGSYALYIAAISKPSAGRKERDKLMRAYPKHPCFEDGRSMNEIQGRVLQKMGSTYLGGKPH